ncbi:cytochrome P450 [Agaribacterium sp. ZY112]|uniref:cytochrome P450 n=1 Tax=Agaribacterium sp. ZY112 TaxID=3233574 RepID=UPI003523FA42
MSSTSAPSISAPSYKTLAGPKRHWLKGNLGQFDSKCVHDFFYGVAREFNGFARIRFMHKNMVIVQDADTVKHIMKNRPERFRRAKVMETMFSEMGIHGVFSAEAKEWRSQRLLMNPAFKPSKIKAFYPKIEEITQRLIGSLNKQTQNIDIQDILMAYTVDVTSSLAFGIDVNTLASDEHYLQDQLNVIFPMLSYRLRAPLPYWRWFKLERDKKLDAALSEVRHAVNGFIEQARMKLESEQRQDFEQAENLLEAMILAENEDGEHFTDEQLFANVVTLLLAGEDTTANTLAWAIDFLVERPELQEQLYQEVQTHTNGNGPISLEQLESFPLISAVLHETMRLKPVAPHLYIEPIKDEQIKGHHCPAGTTLVCLLSGEAYNEQLFPDCEAFKPERWLNMENSRATASQLMPFGFGARLCPGRQLSLVEMRLALIELIRHYRFERNADSHAAQDSIKFTLQPEGLRVDLYPR